MAELLRLYSLKDEALALFQTLLRDAADNTDRENAAAVSIQRVQRGATSRYRIHLKSLAATEIERVFRGHMGRNARRERQAQHAYRRDMALWNYFAVQVQKSFRGYYSRKYRKDLAKRRRYLRGVEAVGDEVREKTKEFARLQEEELAREAEARERRDIGKLASNLHHLVSTTQIRGVYNPRREFMQVPTINEVPVEEHLRHAIKDLLRTRGVSKTGLPKRLERDLNGSLRVPYKGPAARLSLQASAPYEALDMQRESDLILHNILTVDRNKKFVTTRNSSNLLKSDVPPLSKGDPFMEAWANPMLMRGVPTNQQQFLDRVHSRSTLPTYHVPPEKPFVLAARGNKSSVLPNEVFDVIAQATQSGGVTQRHLGSSARFGIPDSSDRRPFMSIPSPPPRQTTLRPARGVTVHTKRLLSETGVSRRGPIPVVDDVRFSRTAPPPQQQQQMPPGGEGAVDPYASSDEDEEEAGLHHDSYAVALEASATQ